MEIIIWVIAVVHKISLIIVFAPVSSIWDSTPRLEVQEEEGFQARYEQAHLQPDHSGWFLGIKHLTFDACQKKSKMGSNYLQQIQ